MADDSELPTEIVSGVPASPRGGAATLQPHEPRVDDGGPGRRIPPVPPTGYGGGGGDDDWDGDDGGGGDDRRVAILAGIVGVLVVVVLFLVLKPGGGDDQPAAAPAAATPTATAEPDPTDTPAASPTETPSPSPSASPSATPSPSPDDEQSGGAPIESDGPTLDDASVTKFSASQGDTVRFMVRNDGATTQEVHVHGYDKTFDVEPGETRAISFAASITGIFEIEFEQAGKPIGELTVEP
jgi:hypothetical protein